MHFFCFLPLLAVVLITGGIMIASDFHAPGVDHPVDYKTSCRAELRTDPFDNSFLGCEDRNGWVPIHHRTTLTLSLLTGMPWAAISAAAIWEYYEAFSLNSFKSYLIVTFDLLDNESTIGSLADVILAGVIGVLIAVKLAQVVCWPGIFEYCHLMKWSTVVKYSIVGGLHMLFYCLNTFRLDNGVHIGAWILLVLETIWILIVYPCVIDPCDLPQRDLAADYRRLKWPWALINTAIAATGLSAGRPFINNWYSTWFIAFACLFTLMLVECVAVILRSRPPLVAVRVSTCSTCAEKQLV